MSITLDLILEAAFDKSFSLQGSTHVEHPNLGRRNPLATDFIEAKIVEVFRIPVYDN